MYTLGPLVLSKPIMIRAPHAPPPLYTTLSLSRLPLSMALPPLSVHDPHGAASTHGPFAVVAGPCPRHHGWPLPTPPRLAPAHAAMAGPCLHRHSWPLVQYHKQAGYKNFKELLEKPGEEAQVRRRAGSSESFVC